MITASQTGGGKGCRCRPGHPKKHVVSIICSIEAWGKVMPYLLSSFVQDSGNPPVRVATTCQRGAGGHVIPGAKEVTNLLRAGASPLRSDEARCFPLTTHLRAARTGDKVRALIRAALFFPAEEWTWPATRVF